MSYLNIRSRLLVAAACLLATTGILCDPAPTGNLYGRVVDTEGVALPGATVILGGAGAEQVQVSDTKGQFRFLGLSPASYQVRVSLDGFSTVEYPNVVVSANRNVTIEVQLSTAIEETITVTSSSPLLDSRKIAASVAVSQSELERIPAARDPDAMHSTESYDYLEENPFRQVRQHPVSTFAADVDTASYSNVRRFLRSGQLPPPDAVRLEEMLNYFRYEDSEPVDGSPLAYTAELSNCPWKSDHLLLRIGLQARKIPTEHLPPRNLVLLLDVSGSMESPDKLPLVRSAMGLLVETLNARDQVAIVVYAGAAGLVLEPTAGSRPSEILSALDELDAGGSTNGGEGIRLAYQLAESMARPGSVNRVVLATDGDFNVGVASRGELVRLIEEEREHGIFLSVLGFGTGNLKDSQMEELADHGNGNYAYVDSLAEARKVLVREAGATLHTLARDVKLQVEWNPREVEAYRLLGYENRQLSQEDFDDDEKDAGELGSGHHVTVLYELVPSGTTTSGSPAPLRYQETPQLAAAAASGELGFLRLRYQPPEGGKSALREWAIDRSAVESPASATTDDYRLAAGVAAFGMLLRSSPNRGEATWELVRELVASTLAGDLQGYRRELLELVEEAAHLASGEGIEEGEGTTECCT